MKLQYFFLALAFCLTANVNTTFCQENPTSFDGTGLENSVSSSEKEIKKKFRQLRRKAPNRTERKNLRAFEKDYFSLIALDKRMADSIILQKAKVERLLTEVEKGLITKEQLDKLQADTDSLRLIMKKYVIQIRSQNKANLALSVKLATARNSAKDYYFNLDNFEEPKIYFYYNQADPTLSQYCKLSSVPDSNFFITEAYTTNFEQFEFFKEEYDSIGSKVIEYTIINGSDSLFSTIGASDVYHWIPNESITYSVNYPTTFYHGGYTKVREFASVDSMEILGNKLEVIRFKDEYTFYGHGEVRFSRMQQSFYAKEIGMVRFLRFDEDERKNVTYILKAIYTEQEWKDLQERHD